MTNKLTLANFESKVLKSKTPAIIDFYADWCGPCRMMAPVFEELSSEFEGKLNFFKIDTQNENELAEKFEVMSIPTLILLDNGKEVGRLSGYVPKDRLKEILDNTLLQLPNTK
jgi:thioredoxin 1